MRPFQYRVLAFVAFVGAVACSGTTWWPALWAAGILCSATADVLLALGKLKEDS